MGAELGKYKTCVSARSTDKEILKNAQDGGIVTQLNMETKSVRCHNKG
jgi:coenzyme F420 hydrogenase subunit beta